MAACSSPRRSDNSPARYCCVTCGHLAPLLSGTERLEFLHFLRREFARNLATRQLLALDVAADGLDDLGIRQRRRVPDRGEIGDRSDDPAHDLSGAGLGQ